MAVETRRAALTHSVPLHVEAYLDRGRRGYPRYLTGRHYSWKSQHWRGLRGPIPGLDSGKGTNGILESREPTTPQKFERYLVAGVLLEVAQKEGYQHLGAHLEPRDLRMREHLPRLLEGRRHLPEVSLRRGSIGEVHNTGERLHVVQLRARRPLSQESLEKIVEITLGDIIEDPLVNALEGPPHIGEHGHTPLLAFTALQDGTRLSRVQETAVLNQERQERLLIFEAIPSRKAETVNTRQAESITIIPKGLEVRMHHILGVAGSRGEAVEVMSHKHAHTIAVQQLDDTHRSLIHVARRRALLQQHQPRKMESTRRNIYTTHIHRRRNS
jgi:hypothetical protein